MIKLINILKEVESKILVPRRTPEERQRGYLVATQKKIQQYIKDGSKGDLRLPDTKITSLPDNFKVGGSLILSDTKITSLPDNLEVGENLNLINTPLSEKYTKEEIKKMIEDKGGYVKRKIYT